jgi:hypothetical protein
MKRDATEKGDKIARERMRKIRKHTYNIIYLSFLYKSDKLTAI